MSQYLLLLVIVLLATCLTPILSSLDTSDCNGAKKSTPRVEKGEFCRILASSGGGDRIAFELGALSALDALFPNKADLAYDVVSGISAGSLLAGLLSRFPVGSETEAIWNARSAVFQVQSRQDIIKDWPGGIWEGLFEQTGIYDSTPLLQKINSWVVSKPPTDRRLVIGAVALEDAKMDLFHEDSENLNLGILASCSVPAVFPNVPITYKNGKTRHYNDGAVKTGILVEPAIEECLKRGFPQDKIIIDMLLCYTVDFTSSQIGKMNTIESTMRALSAGAFITSANKVLSAYEKYPNVNFRYIMQPDPTREPLPSVGLNFNPAEMQYMFERGMNDTRVQFNSFPPTKGGNAVAMLQKLAEMVKDNVIP